jgi:hypothetical protein
MEKEIERITKKRILFMPEAPTKWDSFWVGLLVVFVVSVLPGAYAYLASRWPTGGRYWVPTGETIHFEDVQTDMAFYHTPHFGIQTPLSKPMSNYFFIHVICGSMSAGLLVLLFTTGRVMRWRLADGTVDYDTAEDLHKLTAFYSSAIWFIIIISGALAIPLLHPTLQLANYAELFGVSALFVGTLTSAYYRQWILHRLCAWGLVYSATASVFLLINGRMLQAFSNLSCFHIKAINYVLAFSIPIVGLARDLVMEFTKFDKLDEMEGTLRTIAVKNNLVLRQSSTFQFGAVPFQAARGDKTRRMSLWQHIMQTEPEEEHVLHRNSSIYQGSTPNFGQGRYSKMNAAVMQALKEDPGLMDSDRLLNYSGQGLNFDEVIEEE